MWKQYCRNEKTVTEEWPKNWGGNATDLYRSLQLRSRAKREQILGSRASMRDTTYAMHYGSFGSKTLPVVAREHVPKQSPSKTFPLLSSGIVGAKVDQSLEVYGHYAPNARGKRHAETALQWPREGIP